MAMGTVDTDTFDDARIAVFNAETGEIKTLVEGGTHPRYSPSGHLLYARDGKILAVRLDPHQLEVSGQPFTVLEGVLMSRNSGVANYDVSASGDLAYFPGAVDKGERTLVWVDRNGNPEPLKLSQRAYLHPRISPDMRQLAIEIEGPNHNFYVYDFVRDVLSQMTTDGVSHWPLWSSDGTQLVYRSGLWVHLKCGRSLPIEAVRRHNFPVRGSHKVPSRGLQMATLSHTPPRPPRQARTSWWSRSTEVTNRILSLILRVLQAPRSFRPTAAGSHTVQTKPRGRKFTLRHFRVPARRSKFQTMVAPIPCGRGREASFISVTVTR